jgi:hypothetical protein
MGRNGHSPMRLDRHMELFEPSINGVAAPLLVLEFQLGARQSFTRFVHDNRRRLPQ